jgi:hypothetical protein
MSQNDTVSLNRSVDMRRLERIAFFTPMHDDIFAHTRSGDARRLEQQPPMLGASIDRHGSTTAQAAVPECCASRFDVEARRVKPFARKAEPVARGGR